MLSLYFGNVPSTLSTIMFLIFVIFFVRTIRKPEKNKNWKKAAIITVLMGTIMSALSGVKDSIADQAAVSFEQMNIPLAILCALGGVAALLGVAAAFCKKEEINRWIFYFLSFIIAAKTVVVETLRLRMHS